MPAERSVSVGKANLEHIARPMDVRDNILKHTTRLLAAHGFGATSLQAIADAVGIRKASILYHFPSKNALRKAVLDGLLYRWNEVLPSLLLGAGSSASKRFDAVIGELLGFFADEPDRARLLLRELLDRPAEMERYLGEYIRPWLGVVATYLEQGKASGVVHKDLDPQAWILQMTVLSLSALATADRVNILLGDEEPGATRRFLDELVRVARVSLFVRPGVSSRGADYQPDTLHSGDAAQPLDGGS